MLETPTSNDIVLHTSNQSPADKMHQWRIWVAKDVQRRAILGHYILDGQIAASADNPTTVRHASNELAFPIDESAFAAESVDAWLHIMAGQAGREQSTFSAVISRLFSSATSVDSLYISQFTPLSVRVVLEALQSIVQEAQSATTPTVGVPAKADIQKSLGLTFDIIVSCPHLSAVDRLECLLRWHGICLDAVTDPALLCRYLCTNQGIPQNIFRPGMPLKYMHRDMRGWGLEPLSRMALLHATAIIDIAEQLPQGRSHAIHLPNSLLAAAAVFATFSLYGSTTVDLPAHISWPSVVLEAARITAPTDLVNVHAAATRFIYRLPFEPTEVFNRKNLAYDMSHIPKLLRSVSQQWGVALEMAMIVDHWIAQVH